MSGLARTRSSWLTCTLQLGTPFRPARNLHPMAAVATMASCHALNEQLLHEPLRPPAACVGSDLSTSKPGTEEETWEQLALVLQLDQLAENDNADLLGCLDCLPPFHATDLQAAESEAGQDEPPAQQLCPSPVFSDGSDLEEPFFEQVTAAVAPWSVAAPAAASLRKTVSFGCVHTRLLLGGASTGSPFESGADELHEMPAPGVPLDKGAQSEAVCCTGRVLDCEGAEQVKTHDGPSPTALLLEGLIRRHHAGLFATQQPDTILSLCGTKGHQWLGAATARLSDLLRQIDDDRACGILPSMIRLGSEHAQWLRELLYLMEGACDLLHTSPVPGSKRRKHDQATLCAGQSSEDGAIVRHAKRHCR